MHASCYFSGGSRTSEDPSFRAFLEDQMAAFEATNLGKMPSPKPGEELVVPPNLRRPVPLDQYTPTENDI